MNGKMNLKYWTLKNKRLKNNNNINHTLFPLCVARSSEVHSANSPTQNPSSLARDATCLK